MSDRSRRRPWLAAVLALVVSGLGHAYLRRWARAFGWYVVITVTVVVLVPDAAIDQIFAGELPPLDEIAPVLLVIAASVIDAYVVAVRNNREYERQAMDIGNPSETEHISEDDDSSPDAGAPNHASPDSTPSDPKATVGTVTCPDCGRDADPELDFCQWCATPLPE